MLGRAVVRPPGAGIAAGRAGRRRRAAHATGRARARGALPCKPRRTRCLRSPGACRTVHKARPPSGRHSAAWSWPAPSCAWPRRCRRRRACPRPWRSPRARARRRAAWSGRARTGAGPARAGRSTFRTEAKRRALFGDAAVAAPLARLFLLGVLNRACEAPRCGSEVTCARAAQVAGGGGTGTGERRWDAPAARHLEGPEGIRQSPRRWLAGRHERLRAVRRRLAPALEQMGAIRLGACGYGASTTGTPPFISASMRSATFWRGSRNRPMVQSAA